MIMNLILSNTDLVSTIEDELNLFRSRSISELSSENIEKCFK